jgi:hypothetical protein
MKLFALIALAVVGLVIVRRTRPDVAQRLEGAAKDAAGSLNGDHAMEASGKANKLVGKLRGRARHAVS